jgi:hypothetical protein
MWARWASSVFAGLGYARVNIIAKCIEFGPLGAAGSFGPAPVEIDHTCEIVDRAISRLDDTEREVIYRTYLHNDAAQVTARKCGLTYGYYREVLAKARQRVGDYINGAKIVVVFPTRAHVACI